MEQSHVRHPGNLCCDPARRKPRDENHRQKQPPYSMTSSARARIDGGTVRPSALAVFSQDQVDLAADEFGGQSGRPIKVALRPAVFDDHVFSLDIPGFAEALLERGHTWRKHARRLAAEETDHRHRLLFRAQRMRRGHPPPIRRSNSRRLMTSPPI